MVATPANALNITSAGIIKFDGTATFSSTTVTQFDVLVGGASNAISSVGPGTAGQILQSGGNAANPAYSTATYPSTAGTSGKILISDGTNIVSSTPTYPNASATSGKIIISDGTNFIASTPTYPNAAGTSGNILKSDGTNFVSSSPAGVGASLVLIQSQTVSGSTAVTFTTGITSTYNNYFLLCTNVIPGTNTQQILLQISTDGGSTYKNTTYQAGFNSTAYNSATWGNANLTTAFILIDAVANTAPNNCGNYYLQNMTNGSGFPYVIGQAFYNAGGYKRGLAGGSYNTTATVNAFQIFAASGTISGTFSVYGIKES